MREERPMPPRFFIFLTMSKISGAFSGRWKLMSNRHVEFTPLVQKSFITPSVFGHSIFWSETVSTFPHGPPSRLPVLGRLMVTVHAAGWVWRWWAKLQVKVLKRGCCGDLSDSSKVRAYAIAKTSASRSRVTTLLARGQRSRLESFRPQPRAVPN